MDIVERVKQLLVAPATEWNVIAEEKTEPTTLITGYVLPLASVAALAGFIGGSLVGQTLPFIGGTYRIPLTTGLAAAVFGVVMTVVVVFVISLIVNALAPTFGAEKNPGQAFKLTAYSCTPAWVAGVLQILPALSVLVFLASLYCLYLLYLGLPRLMKCPQDKAVGYTAVVVVCTVVLVVVVGATGGALVGAGMVGSGILSSATGGGSTSDAVFDKDSPLGKLESLGRGLEESAKKAEAAEKAGDQNAQVGAALEGLSALLGGGTRVDPIDIKQLQAFVPETFAGMPRLSRSAEKTGLGVMVSKAEATYGDGAEKQVTLEFLDTGGASGLMGLASWMGVQEEKEDDDGYERTQKVGGRLTHEKASKSGSNEFGIVLGDRFLVSAKSRGLDVAELRSAVSGLDLAKLEALKGAGVEK